MIDKMMLFWEWIITYLQNYISQYSHFTSAEYYWYIGMKYSSTEGFVAGFLFAVLIYLSTSEQQRKTGFLKVLSFIVVANSCMTIFLALNNAIGVPKYQYTPGLLGAADNIISGLILTLVVFSCYKGFGVRSFFFGVATFSALPIMRFFNIQELGNEDLMRMVVRIVLAGAVCAIISEKKYFYISWIWYFVFHIIIRAIDLFMPTLLILCHTGVVNVSEHSLGSILDYYSSFKVDYIIFFIVLVFAVIFERIVLLVGMEETTV